MFNLRKVEGKNKFRFRRSPDLIPVFAVTVHASFLPIHPSNLARAAGKARSSLRNTVLIIERAYHFLIIS
jgi:hypothetical protein